MSVDVLFAAACFGRHAYVNALLPVQLGLTQHAVMGAEMQILWEAVQMSRLWPTAGATEAPAIAISVHSMPLPAGVRRISKDIYSDARKALHSFLAMILADAAVLAEHGCRFTVTVNDIVLALKRNGR